jgi:hypothetical protein
MPAYSLARLSAYYAYIAEKKTERSNESAGIIFGYSYLLCIQITT